MTRKDATPETVLVYVGGDLVGDGLIKLPFARALRHAYPDARITWLAGTHKTAYAGALAPLVAGLIDEVIEEAGFDRWADKLLRRPLAGRHFDLVIDTQRGVPRTMLLRRIRHDRFLSGAANHLLSDIRPKRPYQRPPALIGQLLELVGLASGRPPELGPPPPLDPRLHEAARHLLPDGPTYVGLAPGAGWRAKCWPLAQFAAVANALSARGLTPVFVLGPQEQDWRDELEASAPGSAFPLLDDPAIAPEFHGSPLMTIALAGRFAAAVANDSGAGHMFAAADTPLVSLFGPTSADKLAPATSRLSVLTAQSFGGDDMAAIPVDAVDAALAGLL